jgi:hypothetical protein
MVNHMKNAKLINDVIEQIKRDFEIGDSTAVVELLADLPRESLLAYLPEDDEAGICPTCNGSGEGYHEDTTCFTCKGRGTF